MSSSSVTVLLSVSLSLPELARALLALPFVAGTAESVAVLLLAHDAGDELGVFVYCVKATELAQGVAVVGHSSAEELDQILRLIRIDAVARHHLEQNLFGPLDPGSLDAPDKRQQIRALLLGELHEPHGNGDWIGNGRALLLPSLRELRTLVGKARLSYCRSTI